MIEIIREWPQMVQWTFMFASLIVGGLLFETLVQGVCIIFRGHPSLKGDSK